MTNIADILNKIIVRRFYKQSFGFFLFVFIVFFGVVPGGYQLAYHRALIEGILQAPALLGLTALGWLLYGLKVSQFVTERLNSPELLFVQKLLDLSWWWRCR